MQMRGKGERRSKDRKRLKEDRTKLKKEGRYGEIEQGKMEEI